MSGLIRSVARDAGQAAVDLEREADQLAAQASQKRHEAAVLRAMQAVAATWTPRTEP